MLESILPRGRPAYGAVHLAAPRVVPRADAGEPRVDPGGGARPADGAASRLSSGISRGPRADVFRGGGGDSAVPFRRAVVRHRAVGKPACGWPARRDEHRHTTGQRDHLTSGSTTRAGSAKHTGRIAAEKAGIIKPGIPALTAAAQPEALAVIRTEAARQDAQADRARPSGVHRRLAAARAAISKSTRVWPRRWSSNCRESCQCRLKRFAPAWQRYIGRGDCRSSGAANRRYCSTARTTPRAQRCCGRLWRTGFPPTRPFSFSAWWTRRTARGFCAELATLAKRIVLSPISSARSAKPDSFVVACQAANPAAAVEVAESLGQSLEWCATEPFVVVAGSFYLVGEAMERLGVAPTPSEAERQLNDWGAPGRKPKTLSD